MQQPLTVNQEFDAQLDAARKRLELAELANSFWQNVSSLIFVGTRNTLRGSIQFRADVSGIPHSLFELGDNGDDDKTIALLERTAEELASELNEARARIVRRHAMQFEYLIGNLLNGGAPLIPAAFSRREPIVFEIIDDEQPVPAAPDPPLPELGKAPSWPTAEDIAATDDDVPF